MSGAIDIGINIPVFGSIINEPDGPGIFAGCCITANVLIPTSNAGPVLQFTSADDVKAYFGQNSAEYAQSIIYFKGANTSTTKPSYIYFGRYISADVAPYVRGITNKDPAGLLTSLKAITSGSLTVVIDDTNYVTSSINLAAATSLSNVAALLQTAIRTANAALTALTVTFSSLNNVFTVSSGVAGAAETMSFSPVSSLATLLTFTEASGAYLSQGADAMTPAENMDNISENWQDTFSFWPVDNLGDNTDATALAIATWNNTQGDNYTFFTSSSEAALANSNDTTSLAYQINNADIPNNDTAIVYEESVQITPFATGTIAAADYTQPGSAITLAFKSQAGLPTYVTSTATAQVLNSKKVNYYGKYKLTSGSTNQNTFAFFQPGGILGVWGFIDNLMAKVYIGRQIQFNLVQYFLGVNEVVNDNDGYTQIRNIITSVMNQCLPAGNGGNGIIALGQTFDIETQQEIKSLYGISTTDLTLNGYVIQNNSATQQQRQDRESPPWFVLYVKGSAVQYLPIYTAALQ